MTDLLAIKLSSFPILLNAKSFKLGSRLNTNAVLSSAFISSESKKDLQDVTVEEIYELKKSRILFATNAYAVSFDKNDKGIYGIFDLLTIFGSSNGVGLVISDPSSSYRNEINKRGVTVPGNVVMISYQHDFNSVLDLVDGFIRNTTTDGDSISVHEALYKNKLTLCSSCVDRPKGAVVYQNLDELREILKCPDELSVAAYVMPNSVQQLVRLYLT
ncbi:MAG: hypothetical protein IPM37_10010 [Hahellaceae bacterium]|nr:hypothetical protein [Hahellaceae bacterium]